MKYWKLQNADGKQWLIPTHNTRTALELYQPTGWKGVTLKKVLPLLGAMAPIWSPYPLVSVAVDDMTRCTLEEVFQHSDIEYSVFLGTPSVHQKTVIQVFKGNEILGYAKLTDKPSIKQLFDNEASLLVELHEKNISHIPQCLLNTRLDDGRNLFVMTTEKTRRSASTQTWTPLHESFIRDLYDKTVVRTLFDDSDYCRQLRQLFDRRDDIPDCIDAEKLVTIVNDIIDTHTGTVMPMAVMHGDFTPWNMVIENDKLFVFDWEYAMRTCPLWLDKAHYYLRTAFFVHHITPAQANSLITTNVKWLTPSLLRQYIALIIAIYVCRETGKASSTPLLTWLGEFLAERL